MKEVVLTEYCPGCLQEAGVDNPLLQQPGGFTGIYCIRPGTTGDKGHIYGDTMELREEIAKAAKIRKAKAKERAPKPIERPEGVKTAAPPEEPKEELLSTIEPKRFEVTEIDAERLSELLSQPITDSGSLVGACYSLKMTVSQEQAVVARRESSVTSTGTNLMIEQKQDGRLLLQVYLPWPVGKSMVEKAIFNNTPLQDVVQNLLEYTMQSMFPWNTESSGQVLPPFDGFWMIVAVPELYVGALMDQSVAMGMTPTEYLQAWVYDAIRMEAFV